MRRFINIKDSYNDEYYYYLEQSMSTESIRSSSAGSLAWTLRVPAHSQAVPCIAILCGNWSYGLLPYCGPGKRDVLWESEKYFLHLFSEYLIEHGFFTLSLTFSGEPSAIPPDDSLTKLAGADGLLSALKQLNAPAQWNPGQMICIGHGLGGYVHCQLAAAGIKPASFIFVSGVFSDYEVILTQKYLPLVSNNHDADYPGIPSPDAESVLIAKNLGTILHAARKEKKRVVIDNGNTNLSLPLDPMVFTGNRIPRDMFRYVISPALIIHGTADLDASLLNLPSIEQSIKKNGISPERVIITNRDHWFRPVPKNSDDQIMERLNGECFRREIDPQVFLESISFIRRVIYRNRKEELYSV
jgi:pimeloyl-ACP methyl ester carboxylesterase